MSGEGWCERRGDLLWLVLHVQPGARRDEVVGPLGDRLKVRVAAPPVEGAANARLTRLLAAELAVPPSRVEVMSGHGARQKRVRVRGPWRRPPWLPPECG